MECRRIGLVYDLVGTYPLRSHDPPDAEAEYEPEDTIVLLEDAIRHLRHEPVRLGPPQCLLAAAGAEGLPPGWRVDAALSIAEGRDTRNREAWGPVLLEMLGIPQLGSDALTLSLSLDKAWTKDVVRAAGIPTPPHAILGAAEEVEKAELPGPFPLFVKPRWEGSAKGVGPGSRVEDREALAREVTRVTGRYRQPALVEPFLSGPEYTVTVLGNGPPRALPVLQRALAAGSGIGLHALERHPAPPGGWRGELPGGLTPELEGRLAELALGAFGALACRDFARIDFRLDAAGRPGFLEINPLPTFARDGSFGVLAELRAQPVEALVAEAFDAGLRRLGLG
jgi:D-alanine-D-alanine ligase